MRITQIILIILVICAAGLLIFAGIQGSGEEVPSEEDDWAYPISFLKIDLVTGTPEPDYAVITLTEDDRTKYPVLIAALENDETYLNIHPEGEMTTTEYYAINGFGWNSYVSYNNSLYHVTIGPIGVAPPLP